VTCEGVLAGAAKLYAGDHAMTDPLLSPVYGDFKGFPPTYLVSGTRDMFLSNTVRTQRKLRTAGVVANLKVYEGFSHREYLKVFDSPESQEVFAELGAFLLEHLR
jgi:monoterpene epsilon-lactone hydrolase